MTIQYTAEAFIADSTGEGNVHWVESIGDDVEVEIPKGTPPRYYGLRGPECGSITVAGDGDGHAIRSGKGKGNAIREGKGNGDAIREGKGHAIREGKGSGRTKHESERNPELSCPVCLPNRAAVLRL